MKTTITALRLFLILTIVVVAMLLNGTRGQTPCTTNANCPLGQVCVGGACQACTADSQCSAGQVCLNGMCVTPPIQTPTPTPTPFPRGGNFVIGDQNAVIGNHVTFWGAKWAKENSLSGGPAPSSFKGFANATSANPPACGGSWISDPGNSSAPPSSVGPSITVIVASSITKSGSTIAGSIPELVIVQTDLGYAPDPGHPGTGTVTSVICH